MTGRIEPAAPIAPIAAPDRPVRASPVSAHVRPEAPKGSPPPSPPLPQAVRETPQSRLELGPIRHKRIASSNRDAAGTGAIYRMDLDLYEGRIAFLSREGPALRGYVDTDLDAGAYTLSVNAEKKVWFITEAIKPGLRFSVDLDGPDPFELRYEQPLVLTVQAGMQSKHNIDSVADTIAFLQKERSQSMRWRALMCLSDVLLEDVIDQLWSVEKTGQAVIMDLLASFEQEATQTNRPIDLARVLRVIEGFTYDQSALYVDAFTSYMLDPLSKEPDEKRTQAHLSTVQIRLIFDKWPPTRSIVIYADDISDGDQIDPDPPTYGSANLTYPKWLNRAMTPRIHAAKKAILEQLENENLVSIIEQAHDAYEKIQFAWSVFGLAQPFITRLANPKPTPDKWAGSVGAARAEGAVWRWKGIQPSMTGPGGWVRDFEAGANMSARNAYYQLEAAGTPPGWGYRCGGLQFENFLNGMLIDAKDWAYWGNVSKSMRGLSDPAIAMSKIRQAEAQLRVAKQAGVGLQWRISSADLVPVIRSGFRAHGLSEISVVHVPTRPPPPDWIPRIPTKIF
ncbi:hypothetical protein CN539_22155 [Bacillus toyonensis]|nr:hypothetical protein COO01_24070 [Bacillus toyonensis]PEM61203.1 hypothetical protein CN625_15530 [Bacillus toyonensis]PEN71572.1 hypothetical protein CN539_22155 [Bacillus toyonensis]PHC48190.1 hypothetical protein COF08_23395 [Bacillus toyonensis]